jgi:hypothetical protein
MTLSPVVKYYSVQKVSNNLTEYLHKEDKLKKNREAAVFFIFA